MKKTVYIGAAIILGGLLIVQTQFGTTGQAQPTATIAQGENVVVRAASPKEPVEITRLQVGRKDIVFGTSFIGDENWVSALSSEVRNTSGKTMTELRMILSFETGGASTHRIAIPLAYFRSYPAQSNRTRVRANSKHRITARIVG